jgi:GT2 family glycosyltransferase
MNYGNFMHIAIVILNWNGKENTKECLASLSKIDTDSYRITTIVVDNASTDGSKETIEKAYPEVFVLQNEENLGFSEGNNVGIMYALSQNVDAVIVLNNDTFVDKKFLTFLVSSAFSDTAIGIVAPKIYFAKGFEFHKDRYSAHERGKVFWYAGGSMDWDNIIGSHRGVDEVDCGQYDKKEQTEFASGCCFLIKAEVLKKVGMFDKKYFLYYEDTDLCMRVKKSGYTIWYEPDSVVWHKNAGSAGGSGSTLQDYYITRNRLLFGMRYAPLRAKIALLREGIGLLTKGRTWQKKAVIDFLTGKLGKGSYS